MANYEVMVDAKNSDGDPTIFISGNNAEAMEKVKDLLNKFGWTDMIDPGDITTARGMEMLLPAWLGTYLATGNGYVAFKIIR